MDVSAIKQQAAMLERQGKVAEAAALYREILGHLEGSPGIKREVPLYAKAGDLLLKAGNARDAIEMYERAAEHYAQHGSSKSILVLCLRVLRADRKQASVYLRFARRLLDHGHVEASRTVLLDYAVRGRLAKTQRRLESLESRSEEEVRGHLEQLFDKAGVSARAESPPPQPPEPAASAKPAEAAPQSRLVTADFTPPPATSAETQPSQSLVGEPAKPEEELAEALREPRDAVLPEGETEPPPEAVVTPRAPLPGDQPLIEVARPRRETAPSAEPRRPRGGLSAPTFEPAHGREVLISAERPAVKKGRPVWLWPAVAAVVVLAAAGGLLASGVIRLGGGGEASGQAESESIPISSDSAAAADTAVMLASVGDSAAADSLGGMFTTADSLERDAAPAGAQDSAAAGAEALQPLQPPVAVADSGVLRLPATRLPPGVTVPRPILAVEGLPIESVEALGAGDGYRVVQVLATGERLALTVQPLDQAPAGGAGALRVVTLPGDTAEGIVRVGDRAITARAMVAPDVLERLLRTIVEIR